jgi:hypothetical protein
VSGSDPGGGLVDLKKSLSLLKKTGYQPLAFRSGQGDANNNLFAIVSGIVKQTLSGKGEESLSNLRRSLLVRFLEAA